MIVAIGYNVTNNNNNYYKENTMDTFSLHIY